MIITKDFVFIHMPKTGGTFVHGIFKSIVKHYKSENFIKWYTNRVGFKLGLISPIYQKLSKVSYFEYPNNNVKGQHAGVLFIPKKYKSLPIVSVKRDPIKKFISIYYYRWWERFPVLSEIQLKEIYPHYPQISIEEYFNLIYNYEMKFFFKDDYREDIGVLTWQYIRMYSNNPDYVYKNISKGNCDEFIKKYFAKVKFFEMNQLSTEFEGYLKTTSFAKYSNYFLTEERIYPPGSNNKERSEKISNNLLKKIRDKEWFLYNIFPEYCL